MACHKWPKRTVTKKWEEGFSLREAQPQEPKPFKIMLRLGPMRRPKIRIHIIHEDRGIVASHAWPTIIPIKTNYLAALI